jgi:hypothetical protein
MHSLIPTLVTGDKDPKPPYGPVHSIKQTIYKGRRPPSPKSMFSCLLISHYVELSRLSLVYSRTLPSVSLCHYVCVCYQSLRLYEYSGSLRFLKFLLCILGLLYVGVNLGSTSTRHRFTGMHLLILHELHEYVFYVASSALCD